MSDVSKGIWLALVSLVWGGAAHADTFVYRNDWLQQAVPVTIDVQGASLATVLALCFKDQPFTYEAIRNTIVLRRKEVPAAGTQEAPAPPSDRRQVVGQHQQPQRDHPEAENREESQYAPGNQREPDGQSGEAVGGQWETLLADTDTRHGLSK